MMCIHHRRFNRISVLMGVGLFLASSLMGSVTIAAAPVAAISFEDVSRPSGVYHQYSTAASAWGDFNADGWPDLWVSNHWHQPPSVYVNQRNGTFHEVAGDVLVGNLPADFHGAAWADFDNDGDQDLFVTTGGGAGEGSCPSYLFVNHTDKLRDEAARYGVDYPLGRGRTPLWFDADRDGKLDLLVMNKPRPGGDAPSVIFSQTPTGFVSANGTFALKTDGSRSRWEKLDHLISNAVNFRWRKGAGNIVSTDYLGQLTDMSGDRVVDLVLFVDPMRVYSPHKIPFEEITNDIGFPYKSAVQDVAIEDFDGDGQMDMFLVRSHPGKMVTQPDPLSLRGKLVADRGQDVTAVHFRSQGQVTFRVHTTWIDPSVDQKNIPVLITGNRPGIPVDGAPVTLDPQDPTVRSAAGLPGDEGVFIEYDPGEELWKLRSSLPAVYFTATATQPIERVSTNGFVPSDGALTDDLLVKGENGYESKTTWGYADRETACSSVTAGDFDNDMDVDLYLVCAGPTQNLPNVLYENDGKGQFNEVANSGGAAGSELGIGNQVASADYDRDGFLDLFVTNGAGQPPFAYEGPHQLFRNKGNANHWLEIDLQGTVSSRDAIGATISLEAGGIEQVRSQSGGMHSFSQNHQRIHFGLGPHAEADRITIRWPSGLVQVLEEIAADQILQVVEPVATKQ